MAVGECNDGLILVIDWCCDSVLVLAGNIVVCREVSGPASTVDFVGIFMLVTGSLLTMVGESVGRGDCVYSDGGSLLTAGNFRIA